MCKRPMLLSIAGLDPSAGAGLLADIKTFEQLKVYGLGVASAITYQNDNSFEGIEWISIDSIINQIDPLFKNYNIDFVKFGIIENLSVLNKIIDYLLLKNPNITIIWDPVLRATAGYNFHKTLEKELLFRILKKVKIICPNKTEFLKMFDYKELEDNLIKKLDFNAVITGIEDNEQVSDLLIYEKKITKFQGEKLYKYSKHGTGCIFSSALLAFLSKEYSIEDACKNAKFYVEKILASNSSNLAYHNIE